MFDIGFSWVCFTLKIILVTHLSILVYFCDEMNIRLIPLNNIMYMNCDVENF